MSFLSNLFNAFRRLTEAVNRTAELFETANSQLEVRIKPDDTPLLEDKPGRKKKE